MDDSPETALRAAREQVIASFDAICEETRRAIRDNPDAVKGCRDRVHRLAGVAGIVGLQHVGERALDLEAVLGDSTSTADTVDAAVERLRGAFLADLAAPPPPWLC
jgi:HPt (histidine-containing phosphotransfer) domain-containing protein